MATGTSKVSKLSACKSKKAFPKLKGSYSLRSLDSGRVLRSKLKAKKFNNFSNPANIPVNLVTRVKKGGKKRGKKRGKKNLNKSHQDELFRIRKHIRYIVHQMNYEQSFIDAYSGEGWKGQSAEKIRPEKELGRAKSEILRLKLKIREIFKHLDSLLVEGKLQESLFDPDGIDSENIFCGKCGLKDVSTDNDIILCDGICERGFHQKCLNPPLLCEDIPSGDEGWLCPQCDCKVDCIDLLSEFLEQDLSIESSWKKIFPEAAALATENGQHDALGIHSDDSADDDYNPDTQAVDVNEQGEGPICEDSDSSSSSDGALSPKDNTGQATAELSTDDSEDENYDPDCLDPEKESQRTMSSSDESDFTSDSDEYCAELAKNSSAYETTASSPPNLEDELLDPSNVSSPTPEVEKLKSGLKSSNKRDRERLDYKMLYDEAYGKSSSDSSEDEDWNEICTPKKLMKIDHKELEEDAIHSTAKMTPDLQKSISSISATEKELPPESHSRSCSSGVQKKFSVALKKLKEAFQENQYPAKERKESLAQELDLTFRKVDKWFANTRHKYRVASTHHKSTDAVRINIHENSCKKKLNVALEANQYPSKEKKQKLRQEIGIACQKILCNAFQQNQYPNKEKRESLAQELGMTLEKVTKWFGNARHSFRAAHNASGSSTIHKETRNKKLKEAFEESQYPSKEKMKELAQELGMTPLQVSKWFETAQTKSSTSPEESSNPATPGGNTNSLKSYQSPRKPVEEMQATNGNASTEKERKAGASTPNRGSKETNGFDEEDDRKKAIAKELRRMRMGR